MGSAKTADGIDAPKSPNGSTPAPTCWGLMRVRYSGIRQKTVAKINRDADLLQHRPPGSGRALSRRTDRFPRSRTSFAMQIEMEDIVSRVKQILNSRRSRITG